MAFKFENLQVWQESLELTGIVHEISPKFPQTEQFVLTSQIQRAADSVNLNIAERRKIIDENEFLAIYNFCDQPTASTQSLRKKIESRR